MQRQLQEIQALATKYSKADLGRMVQLGLLEPQKAMMAGMMIQRIEQQNAKPPQSTVAQEVLGLPVLASGPMNPEPTLRKPPQLGAPPAPPLMMAAEGGVLGIPAGDVGEYAGGGIVAFADGGEADVPGYATGGAPPGLFEAVVQAESRGRQSAVSNKGARGVAQLMPGTMRDPGYGIKPVRDDSEAENRRVGQEYLGAMLKKYRGNIDQALAAYNWGPGNVDKHLKKYGELTPEKLPRETQAYIPKVKNFLAQQEQRRPEPVRVAERPPIDDTSGGIPAGRLLRVAQRPPVDDMSGGIPAGQLMPVQDRVSMPTLLRRPLERVTRLLPSAEAAGIEELPAGMQARAEYAGGGIASFRTGGDAEEEFGYYGLPFGGVSGSPEFWERPVMPYGEQMRNVGEALWSGTKRLFSVPETEVKRKTKKEGSTPDTKTEKIDKAQRTGQYGAYNTPEDQFPLQSYQDMLIRRQQGVGYTEDGKIVNPDAPPPPAGEAKPVVPEFKLNVPERRAIQRPELDLPGTKLDPSFYEGPVVPELSEIGKQNLDYLKSQGVDPDIYQKMISAVEEKKGKLAARKGESQGEAMMNIGLGLLGSRRGQEFEDLRKYGQAALSQYKQDIKDLRASEEKLDDRMDAFRIADQQAKQTRAEKDIARRNQLLDQVEKAQADKFAQQNELQYREAQLGMRAAEIATQANVQMYGIDTREELGREQLAVQRDQLALTGKHYTNILKMHEARIKALGQAANAKFMAVKQKILADMPSNARHAAFVKDLKSRYGDRWASIPEAQAELGNFEKMYLGQKLEAMGEFEGLDMPGIRSASDWLAE